MSHQSLHTGDRIISAFTAKGDTSIEMWLKRLFGNSDHKESSKSSNIDDIIAKYEAEDGKIKEAGRINGKHYTEHVEHVRQLKREKKHDEAIELLFKLVGATEKEAKIADWGVAPWYYEQLAIIFRKEKRYVDEVMILERYQNQTRAPGAKPSKLDERLLKARELRDKDA